MSDDAQQPQKTPEELAQEAADEYRAVCRRSPQPLTRLVAAGQIDQLKEAARERPPIHADFWSRALLCAARLGDLEALQVAAPLTDCDAFDHEGQTALMLAALYGHRECVDFLAELSAPSMSDPMGRTALMQAAGRGDFESVKVLSRGAGFSQRDRHGDTALIHAVASGSGECVEFLFPLGDIRETTVGPAADPTIFMKAAHSGNVRALELLLPLFDPQALDAHQAHSLVYAARAGRADAVRFLLPLVDARVPDAHGCTALMAAAAAGQADCARILLESGPQGEQDGRTKQCASSGLSWRLDSFDPTQATDLKRGVLVDSFGQTALMLAIRSKNLECVQLLLPISDMAAKDDKEHTALDLAGLLQQWDMALLIATQCAPEIVKKTIDLLADHPPKEEDADVLGKLMAISEHAAMRAMLADAKAANEVAVFGADSSAPHDDLATHEPRSVAATPQPARRPRAL